MHKFSKIILLLLAAGSAISCNQKSEKKIEERKVSGDDVKIEDFSYMAQVFHVGDGRREFVCGAIIIDDIFAITAWNCVAGYKDNYRILSGSATRGDGVEHTLDKVVFYHKCSGSIRHACIAMIRVKPGFPYDFQTGTAYIYYKDPEPGTKVILSGWGTQDSKDGFYSKKLKKADLEIMDRQRCQNSLYDVYHLRVDEKVLCTLPTEKVSYGDNGEPLVVIDHNHQKRLVGLLRADGLRGQYPAVYADMLYYRDWIREQEESLRKEVQPEWSFDEDRY